jgi:hypothetical protein
LLSTSSREEVLIILDAGFSEEGNTAYEYSTDILNINNIANKNSIRILNKTTTLYYLIYNYYNNYKNYTTII